MGSPMVMRSAACSRRNTHRASTRSLPSPTQKTANLSKADPSPSPHSPTPQRPPERPSCIQTHSAPASAALPSSHTTQAATLSLWRACTSASIRDRPGRQPTGKTIDRLPLNHGPTPFLQVPPLQHRDFARRRQCRFGFGAVSPLRPDHEVF